MNIIIVTTDEPFYLPLTIQKLLESSARNAVKRIILLPPTSSKRSWPKIISEQLRLGIFYFIYRGLQFALFKMLVKSRIRLFGRYYSVEAVANAYSVPITKVLKINSEDSIGTLIKEAPDLILSLSASQIFTKKVIRLARWATINVHNAPLPRYQGLMPSFWVLCNAEKETAVTVHLMDEQIDTGDIIVQKMVPISCDETLDSLITKMKLLTVEALLETFALFQQTNGNPPLKPSNKEQATYYGFPSRNDVCKFRKTGRKVLWKGIY